MKQLFSFLLVALLATGTVALTGCTNVESEPAPGAAMENATEEMGEAAEETTEAAGEMAEEVEETAGEAAYETGEAVEETAEEATHGSGHHG